MEIKCKTQDTLPLCFTTLQNLLLVILKAIAYAGVKNVIEKGVIIDSDFNHKERGYNSFIIAAPISIADENYICEVVVKQNKNESRTYLHEVTEQKKFLNRAFVTNLAQKPAQQGTLIKILNKLTSVNESITCPISVNGEPDKEFVSKILSTKNRSLSSPTQFYYPPKFATRYTYPI